MLNATHIVCYFWSNTNWNLLQNTVGLPIIHNQIPVCKYNPIRLRGFRVHSRYLLSFSQFEAEMSPNDKNMFGEKRIWKVKKKKNTHTPPKLDNSL